MLASGVAPEDLTIIAARNTYVAAREGEAQAFMQPRFQWAGDLARYLGDFRKSSYYVRVGMLR